MLKINSLKLALNVAKINCKLLLDFYNKQYPCQIRKALSDPGRVS
jgi:hypothetical protein